jgi:nicotinamidase-related amidase
MSAPSLDLDPKSTALVLVDLQNFTVALPTQPHSGQAVLDRAVKIADACRAAGVQVVLVRVESGPGNAVALRPRLDEPQPVWNLPPGAHDFPEPLGPRDGDVVVTKYGWGGFYGTDLDVQLRRRGIKTLLMGGLVTGVGLDTTVRQAYERGYDQVILTDVCAGFTQAEHDYCLGSVFPRVARLRTAEQLLNVLEDA